MDKCREDFELAYRKAADSGKFTPDFRVLKNGDYMQPAVYWAYWAWVESRAAIKVELPMWEHLPNGNKAYSATEIKGILKDLGISYE